MNEEDKITLAIVDDHPLIRKGLVSLFSEAAEFKVVCIAGNGKEFIESLKVQIPDIVLLDIEMPEMDGMQVADLLHRQYPQIKILAISMFDDDSIIRYFIEEKGARGFLSKNGDEEIIMEAVLSIMETGYYFDEKVSKGLVEGFIEKNKIRPVFKDVSLSEREIEVLKLICQELTSEEISKKLFISLKTVERHRDNMFKKVGARNIVGLVMYAVQNNLHNKFIKGSSAY